MFRGSLRDSATSKSTGDITPVLRSAADLECKLQVLRQQLYGVKTSGRLESSELRRRPTDA